jgi:predicted ATPase
MLKGLQLGNFKSWREVNAPLAPITGFFGTNSSGKSSLLQALLLMKQSAENSDIQQVLEFGNDKTLVDLGGFRDVIFQNDAQQKLSLGLTYETSQFEFVDKIQFISVISLFKNKVELDSFTYNFGVSAIGTPPADTVRSMGIEMNDFTRHSQKYYRFSGNERPDEHSQEFSDTAESTFEFVLSQVSYLGSYRTSPKRSVYSWTGAAPSNVGQQGENAIAALLAARVGDNKVGDIPLENYIAEKLKDLGLIDSFRLEELREGTNIFRVLVRHTPESPEVFLTDVGSGVSQVLSVLVQCYYAPEGSTIVLELPELHLHPSVQSGLADIFIDAYQKRRVQIIFESHSEHLLRRLQRRIAEETPEISPTTVNLYFCSLENGESKLEPLQLDEYGNIHNYPKDFFGDRFEEMAAMTEAGIERRAKKALKST